MSQPSDLGGDKSAVGDEDQAFATASQNNDGAFAGKRQHTIDALEELFLTKVMILSFPSSPITAHTIMQVLQQCRKDGPPVASTSAVVASTSAVGDGNTGVKAKVASTSAVGDGDTGVPSIEQEKTARCTFVVPSCFLATRQSPPGIFFAAFALLVATISKRW